MNLQHRLDEHGLPSIDRNAWVEVDLDQLTANASTLVALDRAGELGGVVKADGYGHGLEMAARAFVRGGAGWLCVAMMGEARRLRTDGFAGPIFVLYPVPEHELAEARAQAIDVTVGRWHQVDEVVEASAGRRPHLRVHLEVDTGMTRGGIAPADAPAAAAALAAADGVELAGVWSHLAAPEDPAAATRQEAAFREVLTGIGAEGVDVPVAHLAASGGLLATALGTFDLARVGLTLYGENPLPDAPLPSGVAPALAVKAEPVRVAEVAAGTGVGYGGDWVAQRPSVIATLPLGYADGWARSSSPGTSMLVRGQRAPVVGRVSSDATTVDVTDVDGVGPDDEFVLLGAQGDDRVTADEVAGVRKTISWEVLQQLGARLPRVYVSQGRPVAVRATSSSTVVGAPEQLAGPYG